jgi:predicted RNA-binding Zn-ribbon protein involved in translation (DUF1610 family)
MSNGKRVVSVSVKRGKRKAPVVPYTPEEQRDHELAELRIEYASTTAVLASRAVSVRFAFELAHAVATKLGHTAMRQRNAYECPKCGLSGAARRFLDGGIFIVPCGTKYEPGSETTIEEHAARCRYEFSRAREIEAAGDQPGMAALVEGHRECARDYAERVLALKNAADKNTKHVDLSLFQLRASSDPVKRDLEMTCGVCGDHVCDVEPDDTLLALVKTAEAHRHHACK